MAGLIKRGNVYHAVYYVGKKQKCVSLETDSLQLESALYRCNDNPLPTKAPIATVVAAYIEHMRTRKTAKSVVRDSYYLRETFGPICPELTIKNPTISAKGKNARQMPPRNTSQRTTSSSSPPPTSAPSSPRRCGARRCHQKPPTAFGRF